MEQSPTSKSSSSFATTLKPGQPAGTTTFHIHNGQDSPKIPPSSIRGYIERIRWTLPGELPATAANYGVIFIADRPCTVVGFEEVHQTAGSDGSAVTLQLEKLTGTEAPDAGVDLLATALSLKATANTVQTGTLIQTRDVTLQDGDRLCLNDSGTLTAVANVTVTIFIQYP